VKQLGILCAAGALAGGVFVSGQVQPPEPRRAFGASITGAFEGWFYNPDGSRSFLVGYYNRNSQQEIDVPLVIALGDRLRSTGAAVTALRARWEAERPRHERLFDAVAAAVEDGAEAIATGDLSGLGRVLDRNHRLLRELGVSAPEVDALVAAAQDAGALGAKLTGGGAGGAVLALAPEPDRTAAALRVRGVRTIIVQVPAAEMPAAEGCAW